MPENVGAYRHDADPAKRAAYWLIDFSWRDSETFEELQALAKAVWAATPPDTGRDAGGAPDVRLAAAWVIAAWDRHGGEEITDGSHHAIDNAVGALRATLTGGRPAADQYDRAHETLNAIGEILTKIRPAAEPPDVRDLCGRIDRFLTQASTTAERDLNEADTLLGLARAALGAAPPTQEGA